MNKETRNFLNIIKSAITARAMVISPELISDGFWELTSKHRIATMVYYGLYYCCVSADENTQKILCQHSFIDAVIDEKQNYWYNKITKNFEEAGIKYLPLKGISIKKLYPKSEIRRMGDIDILIESSRKDEVEDVMNSMGFNKGVESDHELVWSNTEVCVELHTKLIPSYNKDFYAYFGDGWDKAIPERGSRYNFTSNDTFIYMFTHFAKHYRDSGIGIIHMCDLWLYVKSRALNFDYIDSELDKLFLKKFWYNIKATLSVWFEDAEPTEMTDYITDVIFASGVYGLRENSVISTELKKKKQHGDDYAKAKAKSVMGLLFPNLERMKEKYAVLNTLPFMLPVFWIVRGVAVLFGKGSKISSVAKDIRISNEQNINDYHSALKYVGLDYNFK